MTLYVRDLEGFTPLRRRDGLPFVEADIEEGANATGAFTTLETRALDPIDIDPSQPASRSFTTALATIPADSLPWYRLTWRDASGATDTSDAVQFRGGAPVSPTPQFGLQRVLIGAPATISALFYDQDGVAIDPGSVTVSITRADGTILVITAATTGVGAAARTFTLSAMQTSLLDFLTAVWTSATLGPLSTQVEIVGGFLFSVALARSRGPLGDTTLYPTTVILDVRTWAEQQLEDACGTAFVPRYAIDTIVAGDWNAVRLPSMVTAIRSLAIDGVTMSPSYIGSLSFKSGWLLESHAWDRRMPCGEIVVGYEYGYSTPPAAATRAALDLAHDRLLSDAGQSTIDPRATRVITEDGEIRLDNSGGRFGLPAVDRFVAAQRQMRLA